jgi:hypothetical protein
MFDEGGNVAITLCLFSPQRDQKEATLVQSKFRLSFWGKKLYSPANPFYTDLIRIHLLNS